MLKNNSLCQFGLNEKILQIDPHKHYQLDIGYNVKIMIVTERLHGCAEGLYQCLHCYSDIEAFRIDQLNDIDSIQTIPDIVIVIGYLNTKNIYHKISSFKKRNVYLQSILYGIIDEQIIYEQSIYHVDAIFDRRLPVEQFADFIRGKLKEMIERKNTDKRNLMKTYDQLCKLPMRSVDILALLYVHNCHMEEIACLTRIHIWELYRVLDATLEILDVMLPNLQLKKIMTYL